MKRYLLWDNDGVLVDTELWYFEATRRALANLNITLEQEIYLQRMSHGQSSWELAQAAGVDPTDIKAARHQRDAYYQQYLAQQDIEISGVEEGIEGTCFESQNGNSDNLQKRRFQLNPQWQEY